MDKDLQTLIRLQPLQSNVITYRNNTQLYRVMKNACASELKNLVNVEIDIVQTALKLPDHKMVPPPPSPLTHTIELQHTNGHEDVDAMLVHYKNIKDTFNLLL